MSSDEHVGHNMLPLKTQFPEGLRVLAVDDNVVCLKLLAALLHKCRYKVTITTKATEALEMLRRNKDDYDIVITDVKMLDMDGFELLEIIGLEMDIPVIMMSANDDTESVMKGVKHGARDYLVKPVRMEELKNIWQHVIRKNLSDPVKSSIMKGDIYQNSMLSKRQRDRSKEKEDGANTQSDGESCTQKKQRVTWTQKLHQKFVAAVQQLEVDKAVPKKILELMNEPELTRENVASHLQKYRNLLRKEKKKVITRKESNSYFNSHKTHGYVLNATTISSNNQSVHALNCVSRSGDYGHDHLFPESGKFGSFLMNQGPLFLPMHPQDRLLQQSRLPLEMPDQMQPAVSIPVPGNIPPASLLVEYPQPQPEFSDLKFHAIHSWRNMVDDYAEVSHPVHSHIAGQSGSSSLPLVGFAPYSCSSSAFNTVGAPFQMLGELSSQITPVSLPTSLVSPVRSCLSGRHGVGGNMVSSDGRQGLDFRRQTSNLPSDMRGPLTDNSTGNGLTKFVQPPPESSEIYSNDQHNSSGSTDDDLSIMVKQFADDSAPKL